MKKAALFTVYLLLIFDSNAQSYPPGGGLTGSTAIHKNDLSFVAWATGVQITRGYKKISDPSLSSMLPLKAKQIGLPWGSVIREKI